MMMSMIVVVLCTVVLSVDANIIGEKCDGKTVHGEEVMKYNINRPYQLAIDYDTNTLFFSYTNEDTGKSLFETAYMNLLTKKMKRVDGIVGGFANGVDRENHIVYLGGHDGIYKFDYSTKLAKHIDGSYQKIWHLFFNKDLYYTTYPEEQAYIFKNGISTRVPELLNARAMLIARDNFNNLYFSNSSGLYMYDNISNSVSFKGDYLMNSLTNDLKGNIFFSTINGVYRINDKTKTVEHLMTKDDIHGVAIDSDGGIIYALEDSIVRTKLC